MLVVSTKLSEWLGLYTINWILRNAMTVGVSTFNCFQPELRRALEQLGRGRFFSSPLLGLAEEEMNKVIDLLPVLPRSYPMQIGALIV